MQLQTLDHSVKLAMKLRQPQASRLPGNAVHHVARPACSKGPKPNQYAQRGVMQMVSSATYSSSELSMRSLVSNAVHARPVKGSGGGISDLFAKLQLCLKIFFPDKPKELSPKEEVKKRLKMVLVADRCGMSPGSISELKKTIARALQDFVDIDSEESIEVNISSDPGLGTVYCVAIPVRRVKAESRFAEEVAEGPEGMTVEWDPSDYNSDPSARFPMGC